MQKTRILIVLSSLNCGGAERNIINILNYIDYSRFEILLCIFEKKGKLLEFIPDNIKTVFLFKKNRYDFFKLIFRLRKLIIETNPKKIFSILTYPTLVSVCANSLLFNKINMIGYEPHNAKIDGKGDRFEILKNFLINWSHNKIDLIITDSFGASNDIIKNYNLKNKNKVNVIYNSVDLENINKLKKEKIDDFFINLEKPIIIGFGRLIYRKGFDDLIMAFKLLRNKFDASLIIIGEGEFEEKLKKLIYDLKLESSVFLIGYKENPYNYLFNSDIFVFPSRWEGFGMVIIEAMACNVPVISTQCLHGPEEIITDEINGLLVPVSDAKPMSEAIMRLLMDKKLSKDIAKAGVKRAKDFKAERIVDEYEKMFEKEPL